MYFLKAFEHYAWKLSFSYKILWQNDGTSLYAANIELNANVNKPM